MEESNSQRNDVETFDFAGWGKAARLTNLGDRPKKISHLDQTHRHKLGVWRSTAICGNDITSSVLYVSALAAAQAGALAPVVLLVVAGVLYLFQKVYAEVGSALPLNGGTYTVLLNTTSKRMAAGAACLTLLSYIATAVISASEAMHYATNLISSIPILPATVGLLGLFALLNILGMSESANVALVIFIFHMLTLTVLTVLAGIHVATDPSLLFDNWSLPSSQGFAKAMFFGFAAAMLGISGFESSANFIEEQQDGVFPKTLRNMWVAVAVFNPLISLLSLGLLPLAHIQTVPEDLLAEMGTVSAGQWLGTAVSLDALLVLSGAVLTSYVGVLGLVRRMSLDRCLPQFLLIENKSRQTNHWIIIGFFLLCASILLTTRGDVEVLGGVYAISFLCVMALFAIGNMLLKQTRARLPRAVRANWLTVTAALVAVLVGLAGNLVREPEQVKIFAVYFLMVGLGVAIMFLRIQILKGLLGTSHAIVDRVTAINERVRTTVKRLIDRISSISVIYFTKGNDDVAVLNRAALYVLRNEQTNNMKVIHVYEREDDIPAELASTLATIDRLYPQLRIDFLAVRGTFDPMIIEQLSRKLNVEKNHMFIGTPGDRFPHRIEDLGGVRVIL